MGNRKIYIACALFWIILWAVIAAMVGIELILPSPVSVIKILAKKIFEKTFWLSILFSIARMAAGFTAAVAAGTLLAAASNIFRPIDYLLTPLISAIKSIPVAAFIVLAMLWIKSGYVPILISFLMVLPIVLFNISQAIQNTDKKLLEMAKIYKFSRFKALRFIYIPQCLPAFTVSCTLGIGFAWKASVAAEIIANPELSIGRGIYNGRIYLETAELFAWALVVVILSLLLEKLFKRFMRTIFKTGEHI